MQQIINCGAVYDFFLDTSLRATITLCKFEQLLSKMRIPFFNKNVDGVSEQVCLLRALQTDSKAQADFFEKQEPKVCAAISKHFAKNDGEQALELLSYRDIFHESIIRFYDAIQLHRLYESDGKLFCRDRSGVIGEFKGTLGNYLQCIAKNVFLEKYREQLKHSGISIDRINNIIETDDDFDSDDPGTDYSAMESLLADDFTMERHLRIEAVWAVLNQMEGMCKILLKKFLSKGASGETDKDIAEQLHYKNVNSVKTQRNRCMKVFKSAITKKIASYGG